MPARGKRGSASFEEMADGGQIAHAPVVGRNLTAPARDGVGLATDACGSTFPAAISRFST